MRPCWGLLSVVWLSPRGLNWDENKPVCMCLCWYLFPWLLWSTDRWGLCFLKVECFLCSSLWNCMKGLRSVWFFPKDHMISMIFDCILAKSWVTSVGNYFWNLTQLPEFDWWYSRPQLYVSNRMQIRKSEQYFLKKAKMLIYRCGIVWIVSSILVSSPCLPHTQTAEDLWKSLKVSLWKTTACKS